MKEKTIDINGESFTYMDEVGDPYKFNPMTQEDAQDILKKASELLDECGIEYFLAYGTLLGAVREGNFIKGDEDADIVVTDEKTLYESLPFLWGKGLFINRIFKGELYTFHVEGRRGHLDMYILKPIDKWPYKNWCMSFCGHYVPKRFFEKIGKGKYFIGDISYSYPENPEKLLEWWYGKTWRIPQNKKAKTSVWIRRAWLFPSKMYHKVIRKIKRTLAQKS
jgi:hypothetical protein